MTKFKKFTPEQLAALKEIEREYGTHDEGIKAAKKTKLFLRNNPTRIQNKLYNLYKERIGLNKPKIKEFKDEGEPINSILHDGWTIATAIVKDEIVITYTLKVKLPR